MTCGGKHHISGTNMTFENTDLLILSDEIDIQRKVYDVRPIAVLRMMKRFEREGERNKEYYSTIIILFDQS